MRSSLKNQISDLLSIKQGKKPMLIAFKRQPGIYEHEGKEYNETEFEKLKTKYTNVITFVEFGCGEVSTIRKQDLNIMSDSEDTAKTLLKLQGMK
jgi:hypothetical protein